MSAKSVRTVERAIDILNVIRVHEGTAGISEISRALGLSKSTVHRILVALTNKGIVHKERSSNRYSLGYKLFDLAFSASRPWNFISCAMPYLEELRDQLNETVSVALRLGQQYSYVAQAVSGHSTPVTTVLGRHYPLHWGATGKAMLALVPDEELQEYISSVPLVAATPWTITDPDVLLAETRRICSLGYSVSFSEKVEGVGAVACPIRDRHGIAYGGVTIVAPELRVRNMDVQAVGEAVAEIAHKIEVSCQTVADAVPLTPEGSRT